MNTERSLTNESFNFLKGSDEFLNIILDNINSCILLLDNEMKLQAFNNPLKTIFSNKKDEDLLYKKCGNAIGCAYQIEAQKDCGDTQFCCNCELRMAAFNSYFYNEAIYKQQTIKPFFTYDNIKVNKHLQFSTRLFKFNSDKYIIMVIEDISKFQS